MKVMAINSSDRPDGQSKTAFMLSHLVEGMREAGAEVEVVNLREKKIKTCVGCFTCMSKTPGVCIHQDDMASELYPKWVEADLVIYASPLFIRMVNTTMKRFIERTWIICEPLMVRDRETDRWTHPLRHEAPDAVILSVCGFPSMTEFEPLSYYMNWHFGRTGKLLAEIYRPGAEALPSAARSVRDDITEATRAAGRELIESRAVSEATMARITRPVADPDLLLRVANIFWKTCIEAGVTPKQFLEQGMIPIPESIEDFLAMLAVGFNPDAAEGLAATIQYTFIGDVSGACHFRVENQAIETFIGPADEPDLTIEADFSDWFEVMSGKADFQQSVALGKIKPRGDMSVLMRFRDLFGGGKDIAE